MYLTRITLSPTAFRARSLLSSSQNLHAALAASFPVSGEQNKDGSPVERILWRLDTSRSNPEPNLFVVSPHGPDMDEAAERITIKSRVLTKDYQPVLDRITAGDVYSFRITANPTSYERRQDKIETTSGHLSTHTRKPLHRHDEQVSWLVAKLAQSGAAPVPSSTVPGGIDLVVDGETSDMFTRRAAASKRTSGVTIKRVGFKGHLTVTDVAALRSALTLGIGAAKGYGCGLLTLAPPAARI
ncbi:type I-E CRISPR-associated protein Cas6/Cse3/CasE [Jatrophihabitans lederbergiae]|uniref:Type I-E CRISPR-associated protein Cas6/Cse3/CasE n=1 Tax=Jatrophihabitans lederbergiae TaxID=3075547 RepID=A0ABU2JFL8_9ACTN|nr:type I-E CRISPR-associated protein Cas6/Cse3/CasE [Jatrophihabitans sp. DSM 44399]MDT0263790.1 type I-E CRISPR-associated protein Cas6/Cse3/CasE [Jatrophihabitans sp. DSM 44399]